MERTDTNFKLGHYDPIFAGKKGRRFMALCVLTRDPLNIYDLPFQIKKERSQQNLTIIFTSKTEEKASEKKKDSRLEGKGGYILIY